MLVGEVKNRLVYWMRRTFDNAALENFVDDEFNDILNQVARDLNSQAGIWIERYYKKTVAGETNYELQGKIIRIMYFYYESADWQSQYYSFVEDVIILKESPVEVYQMDIRYIRDIENIAGDTDEIDLPAAAMSDFIDLVKKRLKSEFGLEEEALYYEYLNLMAFKSYNLVQRKPVGDGIMRDWFLPELGDFQYVITNNYVSEDSVVADVAGDYHFIPDE